MFLDRTDLLDQAETGLASERLLVESHQAGIFKMRLKALAAPEPGQELSGLKRSLTNLSEPKKVLELAVKEVENEFNLEVLFHLGMWAFYTYQYDLSARALELVAENTGIDHRHARQARTYLFLSVLRIRPDDSDMSLDGIGRMGEIQRTFFQDGDWQVSRTVEQTKPKGATSKNRSQKESPQVPIVNKRGNNAHVWKSHLEGFFPVENLKSG